MANNFYKNLQVALENDGLIIDGPVEPLDEAKRQEMEEAIVQCEEIVDEIEQVEDQQERTEAAVDQLEQQNDSIKEIVEEEGGLSPAAAQGFEMARRAVVAGLGQDPEEDVGAGIVDQPGLESMVVNRGTVSLEANESMIAKLKAFIKSLWDKAVELWKKFTHWLEKVTNILPKEVRVVYSQVKDLSDDDVANAVKEIGDSDQYKGLFKGGKLVDISKEFSEYNKWSNLLTATAKEIARTVVTATKDFVTNNKDKANSVEASFKTAEDVMKRTEGKSFDTGMNKYTYSTMTVNMEPSAESVAVSKVTKSDLLNALNQGLRIRSLLDKAAADSKALDAATIQVMKALDGVNQDKAGFQEYYKNVQKCSKAVTGIGNVKKPCNDMVKQLSGILKLGKAVVAKSGKAEKTEA